MGQHPPRVRRASPSESTEHEATPFKRPLANHEVVTLAVYLLGGATRYVDTEDVAIKANEIAPGRYTWRKYPKQVNLEIVRVYLSDAKKVDKGVYLRGSGNEGWTLTEKGLDFAQARMGDLEGATHVRDPVSRREKGQIKQERARLIATDAFRKYQEHGAHAVSSQEAASFFRVDAYITGKARERKLTRLLDWFRDDPDLGPAVRDLASITRGE